MFGRTLLVVLVSIVIVAGAAAWWLRVRETIQATATPLNPTRALEDESPLDLESQPLLSDFESGIEARSAPAAREVARTSVDEAEEDWWVEGRVIVPRGTPADERVNVVALGRRSDSRPAHRVEIGPDGSFRVAFAPGTGTGWLSLDATYLYLPTQVTLSPSAMKTGTELLPVLGGCVRGHIVLPPQADDLKNVLVGSDLRIGEPTHLDVPREMRRAQGGARIDASLAFEARGVPTGEQLIEIHLPGAVQAAPINVRVEAGKVHHVVIELIRSTRVTGIVVDPAGTPLRGATVTAVNVDGTRAGSSTDPEGRFRFETLAPGVITVSARAEEFLLSDSARFILAPGQSIEDERIVLRPGSRISGRVLSPDGFGREGVVVVLQREDGSLRSPSGTVRPALDCQTRGGGRFEFTTLVPGSYRVQANDGKARLAAVAFEGSTRSGIVIVEGGSVDDIELRLPACGRVAGRVIGPDGKGISGVRVLARGKEWTLVAWRGLPRTDRDGRFAIEGLPLGNVSITAVNQSSVASVEAHALVRSGETAEVELQLVPGTRVRFAAGESLEAHLTFDIVARDERGHEWTLYPGWFLSPETSSDEEFDHPSYGPLPPGRYVFVATTWEGKTWRGSARVGAEGEISVPMRLDP